MPPAGNASGSPSKTSSICAVRLQVLVPSMSGGDHAVICHRTHQLLRRRKRAKVLPLDLGVHLFERGEERNRMESVARILISYVQDLPRPTSEDSESSASCHCTQGGVLRSPERPPDKATTESSSMSAYSAFRLRRGTTRVASQSNSSDR